jgi:phage-related baseplate assembly protein
MSNAQIIDMSKLPPPQVVEVLDYAILFARMKANFLTLLPSAADTLELESEPLTKLLQCIAFDNLELRQRANESCLAVMLAYARGSDLDHRGALYGVLRLVHEPGDPTATPPIERVLENDDDFRERIQMAPQGFSVAGPIGAYVFHARSADGRVLDASATSPTSGTALVTVLSRIGNGVADAELHEIVEARLNNEIIRPLTDEVMVQSATIINYKITGKVYMLPGPDSSSVLSAIDERIKTYASEQHRLGRAPTLSGIYAALHIDGVQRVELTSPAADVAVSPTQAAWCSAIDISFGGLVE